MRNCRTSIQLCQSQGRCVGRLHSGHVCLLGLSAKSKYDASVFAGRGNEALDSSVRERIAITGVDREGVDVHIGYSGVLGGGIDTLLM